MCSPARSRSRREKASALSRRRLWAQGRRAWRRAVARPARLWAALLVWATAVAACYVWLWRVGAFTMRKPLSNASALHPVLRGRAVVFAASPGRAGSMFLRAALGAARAVVALHEPAPRMTGTVLADVLLRGRRTQSFAARAQAKIAGIEDALAGTELSVAYAETSHMFVKSFADVILREVAPLAANVTIVVLERDLADVMWSQIRLGWFVGNHSGKNVWYYDVEDVHATERVVRRVRTPENAEYMSPVVCAQIDSLYGYNVDVRARTELLVRHIAKGKSRGAYTNVHIARLKLRSHASSDELSKVSTFLESLGLTPDPGRVASLSSQNFNQRDSKKDRLVENPVTRAELEARIRLLTEQEAFAVEAG